MRLFPGAWLPALSLGLALAATPALAGPLDAPWDYARPPQAERQPSGGGTVLLGLLRGWQEAVSPVDAIRCPSQPSCSHYAAEAVRRHGAALGAFMAADRMIHEASEAHYSPPVWTPAGYKIDDPLSANDFWLTWR